MISSPAELPIQNFFAERNNIVPARLAQLPLVGCLPIVSDLIPVVGHRRPPGHPQQYGRVIRQCSIGLLFADRWPLWAHLSY